MYRKPFTAETHFTVKALERAGILFPASKAEILEKAGDAAIKVDYDKTVPLSSILARMDKDYFTCANDFYSYYFLDQTRRARESGRELPAKSL